MMRLLPPGLLGLVFAALVAAIIASTASKINSIATIFTLDLYAKFRGEKTRRKMIAAKARAKKSTLSSSAASPRSRPSSSPSSLAKPLVGSSEQAFQYIQEFSGFFTPGITVIFLSGLFWKRATEAGAIVAAVTSVLLSTIMKYTLPAAALSPGVNDYLTPFINRMGVVFLVSLVLAVLVSLATPQRAEVRHDRHRRRPLQDEHRIQRRALGVILILIALYATWW